MKLLILDLKGESSIRAPRHVQQDRLLWKPGLVKTLWHQEPPSKDILQMCCRCDKTPDLLPERSGYRQGSTIFSPEPETGGVFSESAFCPDRSFEGPPKLQQSQGEHSGQLFSFSTAPTGSRDPLHDRPAETDNGPDFTGKPPRFIGYGRSCASEFDCRMHMCAFLHTKCSRNPHIMNESDRLPPAFSPSVLPPGAQVMKRAFPEHARRSEPPRHFCRHTAKNDCRFPAKPV